MWRVDSERSIEVAANATTGFVVALSAVGALLELGVAVTTMATISMRASAPEAAASIFVWGPNDDVASTSWEVGPSSDGWRHARSCGGSGPGSTKEGA